MDHDVYTTNDAIGLVYVDLSPLFMRTAERDQESRDLTVQGWFPLYDTLRGVRGALCLVIKVRFIGDQNPFRESSAGVQFFGVSTLNPELYTVQKVVGLVDELVVDNDPEYQWMDNFRQARTSNESRQSLLYKLDATVRRQLGKKVLDLGCNAVLAYQQDFDVEGDSGIVARAYGTACVIQRREQHSDITKTSELPHTRQLSAGHGGDGVGLSPGRRFYGAGGGGSTGFAQDLGFSPVVCVRRTLCCIRLLLVHLWFKSDVIQRLYCSST
ncbi:unnamed protein product [Ectocarpus sp. 13 AM-2016]